ncbi:MAG: zinc-finger domain-containing protein [Candidatus Kinetoplastibacterium crithidii]|nr:zinc-finger domain-containing protein [Candidatus Kinetoplastibacterium crithidii]
MKTNYLEFQNHHNKNILSCPDHETEIWNMHPRIFLDLTNKKITICPYCGAKYQINKQESI